MPRTSLRRQVWLLILVAVTVGALVTAARPAGADTGATLSWPDRRFATCGAVDPAEGVLYAFGGRGDDGTTHHGDLWAMDLGGGRHARPSWTLAAATGSSDAPPPVRSCAATWDGVDDRLIVFGGWNGRTHDGGVRAFDPTTGAWDVLCDTTSCGPGPAPRRASQIAHDARRGRLLVFGGTSGPYFDDLWSLAFETGTWTRLDAGPISRGGHSMAIDPDGDDLWLFGGTRPGSDLDDLWRLDLTTDTWAEVSAGCPCPSPRSGASLVADTAGDRLVLYGGWESSTNTYRSEAWTLEDLDGAPEWELVDPRSESPQARFFHVAGYDPLARQMVVFAGGAFGSAYKDAFGLSLPTDGSAPAWHTLSPTTTITARDQVTVVLDRGMLTAFGGFGSGTFPGTLDAGTHLADTWQRAISSKSGWRLATPTDEIDVPVTREGTAYAHDAASQRLVLFGGLTGDTTLADVWEADLARPGKPRWRQVCSPTSCGVGPSARWGGHAVFDPAADRFVVFGGLTEDGTTADDVWALDMAGTPTWHELEPDGPGPVARWSAAYGYDAVRNRLVLFGGQTGPDATGIALQDAWALSLAGEPRWTRLAVDGARPAARRSPAAAVRLSDDGAQFVVATGLGSGVHHNDVWSLDLGDDSATWIELAADAPGVGPAPRRSASAVHDPVADRLIVVFGRDAQRFSDETWAFDLTDLTWSRLPG